MFTRQLTTQVFEACPDYRGWVRLEIEGRNYNPGVITDIIPGDPYVDTVVESSSDPEDRMGVRQFLEEVSDGDPDGEAQLYHKGERYEGWYDVDRVTAEGQMVTVHAGEVRCTG